MTILIIYLLILILPTLASLNINANYSKYKKVESIKGIKGKDVAREILDRNGLKNISVVETQGILSDCYDSSNKCVKLSPDIYNGTSVASLSVAAHECGHAIQDKENYFWMVVRKNIYPVVSIGTSISYYILLAGLFLNLLGLVYIAIILTSLGLIFQLVTLPVEFDASRRARIKLNEYSFTNEKESKGVKNMLKSAALTYVAGVLASALSIVELLIRYGGKND